MEVLVNQILEVEKLFEMEVFEDGTFRGLLFPPHDNSISASGKPALEYFSKITPGKSSIIICGFDDSGLCLWLKDTTRKALDKFRVFMLERDNPYGCPSEEEISKFAKENGACVDYW